MGLPNIRIEFVTKAGTAIKRGSRGIVAIILIETTAGVYEYETITDIPISTFTADNESYIKRTFLGGINPIKKVVVIATDTVTNGLIEAEKHKFDYIVGPHDVSTEDATAISTAVKAWRDNKKKKVKVILPNTTGDHEGIINFTTASIVVGEDTFTTSEYCSRIAGLIAGTPLQESITFKVLSEVTDVPKYTDAEFDTKINNGELCIKWDGEKAKIARGINSLKTVGNTKSDDMKSIKIIDIMDMIENDIRTTAEDNYIGKYANNYNNKNVLVVAIRSYLDSLRAEELLEGNIYVGIDVQATKTYLDSKNVDTSTMKDIDIKKENTGTNVFIEGKYKITNAIEDISIKFYV